MKQIKIIFENDGKKIGYLINPDTHNCQSGTFNEAGDKIVEYTQNGVIDNPEELCRQIYYVLLAGVKNG